MKAADFRNIALGMKDTIEGAHMGHPDFRVNGRVFASLHEDLAWGMVGLTADQQQEFVHEGQKTKDLFWNLIDRPVCAQPPRLIQAGSSPPERF
jgi:hypothetical protein